MYDGRRERVRYGYTQNQEEKYIVQHCGATGRFLDIGAHDGISFSSSRALLEKGWGGVYVEPDPHVLPKLRNNVASFSNVEVLPVAIGNQSGKMTFYSAGGDMVGSLDSAQQRKWKTTRFQEVEVNVLSLRDLESRIGHDFQFINLDVEGLNWEIFQQFDWNVWRPRVVCIEYDNHYREMCDILRKAGYEICYASPENIVAYRTR